MRILLYFLILSSFNAFSQRVEFNDPDLTFGFVKPTGWKVKDDLVVMMVPADQSFESSSTFFSITYFEEPEQPEGSDLPLEKSEIEPSIPLDLKEFKASEIGRIYIANEVALWASYYHTQNGKRIKAISYVFKKLNQRFEITISAPLDFFDKRNEDLQKIISSINISNN